MTRSIAPHLPVAPSPPNSDAAPQTTRTYNPSGSPSICAVDCGLKLNQVRCLVERGARVDVVPWDATLMPENYDGFFLSNGPGDPKVSPCPTRGPLMAPRGPLVPPLWPPSGPPVAPRGQHTSNLSVQVCAATVAQIQALLSAPKPKPVFGICLGHQVPTPLLSS